MKIYSEIHRKISYNKLIFFRKFIKNKLKNNLKINKTVFSQIQITGNVIFMDMWWKSIKSNSHLSLQKRSSSRKKK